MDIQQILQQTGAVGAISRELGVDPGTAEAGAAALMPSILSGFQQPAAPAESAAVGQAAGGAGPLAGLLQSIAGLGGAGLLDNVTSQQPTDVGKGNEILGQIFGSKDRSRSVAAQASVQSGIEPSLLKKMLPMLAMAAAGYVMKQAGQSGAGGLGGLLGGLAGGAQANEQEASPSSGSILGQLIGVAGSLLQR